MEKLLFFRAATSGLRKYHTGSYSGMGVYRVKSIFLLSYFKSDTISVNPIKVR